MAGKRVPERFEVTDADLTPQLTEEQKSWKVGKLRPIHQRFEVLEQQPTIVLKLHLRAILADMDPVALAADILALIQALNTADRELGGGGLVLSDRRAEPGAIVLVLRHAISEGAADRAAKLADMLNTLKPLPIMETNGGALEILGTALSSSRDQVKLLLAGSRNVTGCEVLAAV